MKKLVYILAALTLSSCSPRIVEHVINHHDTVRVERVQFDSIHHHDSIYLHEYLRGDTVYIDKTSWKIVYKERLRYDTVYISRTDTVQVTKVVEVAKKRGLFARIFDAGKWIVLTCVALFVAAVVIRLRRLAG